ncbi:hypothetical protein [Pseudomonas paraversuta]|uniref:hypothetical protein n=1 Tax=Pseudomonas paraversuta TaxID=2750624 RepID=UPI00193245EC|nr:hypothetical protein [Pseudomonas paraversuta]
MFEAIASYFDFMSSQLSLFVNPYRIWCFYEQFGLRTIIILVNSGIVAFALPNILDQSECKLDRDAYIKSLFERRHLWMIRNSWAMLIFSTFTVLTYLAIWSAVSDYNICNAKIVRPDSPARFSGFLAVTNILAIVIATFALSQKIFCMKHKQ